MPERSDDKPESQLLQRYLPLKGRATLQRQPPPFVPEEDEPLPLLHYVYLLLRRKWLILAVAVTVVVLVALQVFTTTPIYRTTVTIQVDLEGEKVLPYPEIAGSAILGSWLQEYLQTQSEKLKTRRLARRVVRRLNLAENEAFQTPVRPGILKEIQGTVRSIVRRPFLIGHAKPAPPSDTTPEAQLAEGILGGLEAKPLRNTRLIKLSYSSPDPRLAALIVNTLAEEFIEEHLEGKFFATTRASDFLEKQLKDLQIKVEQSEEALLKYAQAKNIVNLSERDTIARTRLADLSDQLTEAEGELITQTTRYRAAQRAGDGSFSEILKSDRMRQLESRISEKESKLAGFSKRYGPKWPAIRDLHLEIQELQRQLRQARRQAVTAARQEYDLANDRRARLAAALDKQQKLVDRLNQNSIQYNILKRESESNKDLYEGLLQRLKEAGVAAGLRSSNIRIADEAPVPRSTAFPRKTRALTQALLLGLFLGVAGAFLVETLDNTIKTTEDITQYLGLPALGLVPTLKPSGNGSPRSHFLIHRRTQRAPGPRIAYQPSGTAQNRALEAYRSLRTSLLLSNPGAPPQAILVTSALPGEGKSTTGANTAICLAQTGARTLLIDLDLRKPALAKAFGVSAEQGMTTFLTGNSDLSSQIHQTAFPNLHLVPTGPRAPNPPELIGSERMATGLRLVREYFNYIVIDSPPVLEITDALVVSPKVDGVILVVQGGKTPRKAVAKAAERFATVGAKLLGVLINDVDVERSRYGYYYPYYDSYSRYYSSSSEDSKRTA